MLVMLMIIYLARDGGLFAVDAHGRERWIPWREAAGVVGEFARSGKPIGVAIESGAPEPLRGRLEGLLAGETIRPAPTPPGAVMPDGATSLMAAAFSGYLPFLEDLLEAGAAVDERDTSGYTALMYAAQSGNLPAVSLLLRRGARANARDHHGNTALMFAAQRGSEQIVDALLEAHADPQARGSGGWLPADFARANGWISLARDLEAAAARRQQQ